MYKTEEKVAKPKVYSWRDLINFENKQRYSSIGKQIVSQCKTMPMFSSTRANRESFKKIYFSKELANINYGKSQIHLL